MEYSKLPYYVLFLCLFIVAQSFSMWGQFVTLPYKKLSMWEAYKMAIPFAWLDWIVMTFTVMVGDKYELVTPTQDTFLLIIIQFCLILIINQFYLKQKVTRSDIVAFFIILLGFFVSFLHLISKLFGIKLPKHHGTDNPDTASSTLRSQNYNSVVKSKSDVASETEAIDKKKK
jgi:uncharacterized membrane protein